MVRRLAIWGGKGEQDWVGRRGTGDGFDSGFQAVGHHNPGGKTLQFPSKSAKGRRAGGALKVASRRFAMVNKSVFKFLVETPFPLGKNENKWHKSYSYIPHTHSDFRDL